MPTQFGANIVIDGSSLNPHHGHPAAHGHHQGHQLSPEAQAYESSVKDELLGILMFRTGQAVVHEIWERRQHRRLRIVPWTHPQLNALTTPTDYQAAVTPGLLLHDEHGVPQPSWGHGTGHGSDVRIDYSPSISASDITLYFLGRNWEVVWMVNTGVSPLAPGNERGELLLHEMVHALGNMAGRATGLRPEPVSTWDDEDEVRAIIVTNIYSSERGRPLRTTHRPGIMLQNPGPWSGSIWFNNRLKRFTQALPALVHQLREIDTPFNPFRGNYGITDAMR